MDGIARQGNLRYGDASQPSMPAASPAFRDCGMRGSVPSPAIYITGLACQLAGTADLSFLIQITGCSGKDAGIHQVAGKEYCCNNLVIRHSQISGQTDVQLQAVTAP